MPVGRSRGDPAPHRFANRQQVRHPLRVEHVTLNRTVGEERTDRLTHHHRGFGLDEGDGRDGLNEAPLRVGAVALERRGGHPPGYWYWMYSGTGQSRRISCLLVGGESLRALVNCFQPANCTGSFLM